jgi:hypothetical protein
LLPWLYVLLLQGRIAYEDSETLRLGLAVFDVCSQAVNLVNALVRLFTLRFIPCHYDAFATLSVTVDR